MTRQAFISITIIGFSFVFVACNDQKPPTPPAAQAPAKPTPEAGVVKPQKDEFMELVKWKRDPIEITLTAKPVSEPPIVDGSSNDSAWKDAEEVITLDRSSQREIKLKAVHTNDMVYICATFADGAPSLSHKSWLWDLKEGIYKQGLDREDSLVLKWSMSGNDANLSFRDAPEPHQADIWYWKAFRTGRNGYADDKIQRLGTVETKKTTEIKLPDGGSLHLSRSGDKGTSAYKEEPIPVDYTKPLIAKYSSREPTGSRADVKANGQWLNGQWTVEFARKLNTNHPDDQSFVLGQTYLFGVSCYENIPGEVHPDWTQPLFHTGDIFDRLHLNLATE